MATVGTFTKHSSSTVVEVDWNGQATATGASGSFCDFQVQIDGMPPDDNAGRAVMGITDKFGVPTGVTALFSDLAAGTHTVQVYDRGDGASCSINVGNFPDTFLVNEQP